MIKILGIKFYWKAIMLGITLTPVLQFIEKYFFNDWEYLIWLFILISMDTFTGVWCAFKRKEISSKGWGQVINKITVYGVFLIVTHTLQHYTVGKTNNGWFGWIDNAAFGTLMVREAISVFENLSFISPKLFPVSWIDRLKNFETKKIDDAISDYDIEQREKRNAAKVEAEPNTEKETDLEQEKI